MIDEHWNPSIGVKGGEPGLLMNAGGEVDGVERVIQAVGFAELFEKDRDFIACVRCSEMWRMGWYWVECMRVLTYHLECRR